MSGGSRTQTQTTSNQPYAAAQPLYNRAMGDALTQYNQGNLVQPNTMSTVVPYSQQTMQGLNALQSQAQRNLGGGAAPTSGGGGLRSIRNPDGTVTDIIDDSGMGSRGAPGKTPVATGAPLPASTGAGLSGQMQGVIDRGGFNQQQQQALGQLSPFASGQRNVDTSGFQNQASGGLGTSTTRQDQLYGQSGTPSYSEQNLSSVASGGMLSGGDPYFEDVLNRASEEARFAADRTAGGMGRYGSADHYGAMASDVADLQLKARSDQYNRERANQMAANQQLDSARLGNLGFGLNAANSASGIEQGNRQMQAAGLTNLANTQGSNFDRQMSGISSLFNAGQTGFGNMPTAYQNMQMPANTLATVGGAYEDLAGRELNDRLRIAQEQSGNPLANIQALNAIASGAGGYGTGTTSAQMPNSGFSNIMGGLLGGASLLGGLF